MTLSSQPVDRQNTCFELGVITLPFTAVQRWLHGAYRQNVPSLHHLLALRCSDSEPCGQKLLLANVASIHSTPARVLAPPSILGSRAALGEYPKFGLGEWRDSYCWAPARSLRPLKMNGIVMIFSPPGPISFLYQIRCNEGTYFIFWLSIEIPSPP